MGIGLVSLGLLFNFTSLLIINGQNMFPTYVCYIFVLLGVLLIKRRSTEKYFDYALFPICLIIIWEFIYIKDLEYIVGTILTISIWYLVLQGIYKIPFEYQNKEKYRKRIKIWLILLILLNIPLINGIILLSSLGIVGLFFFGYTLSISYNLSCINRELEREYEEIIPIKSIPRKKVYTIISIVLMITTSIALVLFEKPYTYTMEEAAYHNIIEGSFFLENEKIIIDNLAFQRFTKGSGTESTAIDPTIYLHDSLCQDATTIMYRFYHDGNPIIEYAGPCKKSDIPSNYPGYSPFVASDENHVSFSSLYSENLSLYITMDIKIMDKSNATLYELNAYPLKQATGNKYSYEDHEISIKYLEIYNDQMIKAPSIHLKDK